MAWDDGLRSAAGAIQTYGATPTARQQNDAGIQAHKDAVRERMSFGGGQDANAIANNAAATGEARAQRMQGMGAAAAGRAAYQNNWNQANAARFGQNDAAGLMQSAAYGKQPSQAELMGRNMIDQSINSSMAMGASARGGALAQAAAMRNAQNQAGMQQQQGTNQLAALRAQEMAQARGDYMASQNAIRGQDMQQVGMDAQNEMFQRGLNQQAEMGYEQMGMGAQQFGDQQYMDALAREQQGQIANANMESGQFMQGREIGQHQADRRTGLIKDIGGAAVGAMGSMVGMMSDMRAKTGVMSLGQAAGGMMLSDARAKREAYEMGRKDTLDQIKVNPEHGVEVEEAKRRWRERVYMNDPAAKRSLDETAEEASTNVGKDYATQDRKQAEIEKRAREYQKKYAAMAAAEQATQRAAAPATAPVAAPAPAPSIMSRLSAAVGFRADGGPVAAGRPYVVGERGPELVVPQTSGYVVPNEAIDLDEPTYDLDEPEAIDLDRPQFDQRPPAGMQFRRDTPGEQRGVKRAYEDAAGREAESMLASFKARSAAPSSLAEALARQDRMAEANRSMEASVYEYKPEHTPPEQAPGEKNVGPMAQSMASDPVAATAVKRDPKTGMLMLDAAKMTKLNSAGIASLQRQVDSLAKALAKSKKGGA
jgi:hypothetical protein